MKNDSRYVKTGTPMDEIMRHRNMVKMKARYMESKPKIFRYGILVAVAIIAGVYFFLPQSYVKTVTISENYNLNADYIQDAAKIDADSRYYLTFPLVERIRLKNNPMIEDADVSWLENNEINITVHEKKAIGYCYEDNDPVVLMSDGSVAAIEKEYIDIIANVPQIFGFTEDEQRRKLCNAFAKVNNEMISQIAEVTQYDMAYDPETIKILMRTGTYFLTNYHDLHLINSFNKVYNRLNDKNMCIFAFSSDIGQTIYTRECPWNETDTKIEYWTDETGKEITNEYGDKVAKHYYQKDNGKYAKDKNGNQIPVPIDDKGHEVYDENFMENFKSGYYDNGILEIPATE